MDFVYDYRYGKIGIHKLGAAVPLVINPKTVELLLGGLQTDTIARRDEQVRRLQLPMSIIPYHIRNAKPKASSFVSEEPESTYGWTPAPQEIRDKLDKWEKILKTL